MNSISVGRALRIPIWNSLPPIDRTYSIVAGDVVSWVYAAARQPPAMMARFAPFSDHTIIYPKKTNASAIRQNRRIDHRELSLGGRGASFNKDALSSKYLFKFRDLNSCSPGPNGFAIILLSVDLVRMYVVIVRYQGSGQL